MTPGRVRFFKALGLALALLEVKSQPKARRLARSKP